MRISTDTQTFNHDIFQLKSSSEICETLQELGIESFDTYELEDSMVKINGVVIEVSSEHKHERHFYKCRLLTESELYHIKFFRICTHPKFYVQNSVVYWPKKFEVTELDGPYTKIEDDGMLFVSCNFKELVSFLKRIKQ